jgi:hypothetical protein
MFEISKGRKLLGTSNIRGFIQILFISLSVFFILKILIILLRKFNAATVSLEKIERIDSNARAFSRKQVGAIPVPQLAASSISSNATSRNRTGHSGDPNPSTKPKWQQH